jgi:hypothetical protein
MPVSCFDYSSTMKMEVICSSESSAGFHRAARNCVQDNITLRSHRRDNLKSKMLKDLTAQGRCTHSQVQRNVDCKLYDSIVSI